MTARKPVDPARTGRMRCGYCGRFMAYVDNGADYGSQWECVRDREHAEADPERWSSWQGAEDQAGRWVPYTELIERGETPNRTFTR